MMNFKLTPEFSKDLKKLSRKYRSLPEDFIWFKKMLAQEPLGFNKHFTILHVERGVKIMKARLACCVLKRSSLRVIYAYHKKRREIELIQFIELYPKNAKAREDWVRINNYLKTYSLKH